MLSSSPFGEHQKRTAGKGREKTSPQFATNVTTLYDNYRHFMTISVSLFHWHNASWWLMKRHKIRHKMSQQFVTIYDIFCPVPFHPSPFRSRRVFLVTNWTKAPGPGNASSAPSPHVDLRSSDSRKGFSDHTLGLEHSISAMAIGMGILRCQWPRDCVVTLPKLLVSRAAKRGGGGSNRGGFPDLGLSFFVPFGTFPIFLGFSRFARGWSGDFPICPFPLSRPINSAYEEQSGKGLRHNPDLSRKKFQTPRFGTPQSSFSQLLSWSLAEGETHPQKGPTQIKEQFAQTISEHLLQIAPSFSSKQAEKQARRVCANCLCKLFCLGWVSFWVGCLPLILFCKGNQRIERVSDSKRPKAMRMLSSVLDGDAESGSRHNSEDLTGNQLRCTKSAMCIAAIALHRRKL